MLFGKQQLRICYFVLFLLGLFGNADAWQGKVVGISDGDTITVMHEGRGEKIRLYGVDSPEGHQDYGQKAKQFTSDLVFGKVVEVEPETTDRYGRTVGIVSIANQNLNEELIRSGYAREDAIKAGYRPCKVCNP